MFSNLNVPALLILALALPTIRSAARAAILRGLRRNPILSDCSSKGEEKI